MATNFHDNDQSTPVRCGECGGVATANPEAASDCTCEYASCGECGGSYITATQQALRACGPCEERHAAEDARTEWQRRPTVEIPVLVTVEAIGPNGETLKVAPGFDDEGLRRMGVAS